MTRDAVALGAAHAGEVQRGERYTFGKNWARFLRHFNEERAIIAEQSLADYIGTRDLRGTRFLDIGSGSGLFSLAARRLGAEVVSFDFDPDSVACTRELRRRYFDSDAQWRVEQGSVLDADYVRSLGTFDVVYSWGVLHHTGALWQAMKNVEAAVRPGGKLFIAIYNDQGAWSSRWTKLKRFYCSGPLQRSLLAMTYIPYVVLRGLAADLVWGRNPVKFYTQYSSHRGIPPYIDWFDWLGGYPFEVAKPEAIFDFWSARGFVLRKLVTCGGTQGCNEYVFERPAR